MGAVQPLDLTQIRHDLLLKPRASTATPNTRPSFKGAMQSRLNLDWAIRILSADQEIRSSLTAMRSRCRNLANNNDYATRFLNKAEENVVGSTGIGLEMDLDPDQVPNAEKLNRAIEDAWDYWCESVSVDGKMTIVDALKLWIRTKLQDGEVFVRSIKGYPYNPCRYAVQFIDADTIDVNYQRRQHVNGEGIVDNEIRMGIEIDEWHRPLFYYMYAGHPAEMASTRRLKIPAEQIAHAYVFKRVNQSRGIPWMHTAMTRLNMLGGYEEAELVAARLEACKMGFFISKTGDEYPGGKLNEETAEVEIDASPGGLEELPAGIDFKEWNPQHPNNAFPEFTRALLRGAAAGLNVSYASLSADLRDVNFSSLRQGVLEERDGWRVLQTFAVTHGCRPIFRDWLTMAVTSGQLELPPKLPLPLVCRAANWVPRGWDWVDPKKDVDADTASIRSGQNTLSESCAKRGKDWRDVIDQRAVEIAYAKEKGVPIDLTTSGAGGVQGDVANEDTGRGGNSNA
jgi:lambda family phage portal protein